MNTENNYRWQPIFEADIWQLIIDAKKRMTIAQIKLWEIIKLTPVKW